ncbi:pancreatic triacylglycerol lipase-like [Centruroides sculpturatus]|uniref:pancreatic triacylglycerol lipase-like n=1 Tax=Centruroides sculpturatus TaxID=218467 RepID=UPI000C6E0792|nr:pancreatic triacylglycerol lipase-like [Centruroides sculpturatus]
MKGLGCFEITSDFFNWKRRPINLLPQPREVINTLFKLYTNTHPREHFYLSVDQKEKFLSSPFNPEFPTKFIIHGYIDSELFGPWQTALKDEMLLKERCNVIIVDWSGGNQLPYTQATSNTRVVGAEIALLVETLEEVVGLKRSDVHIIGHSLGAHIAGYAGERLPGLGRITGLDPAEPYFQGLPPIVRLDETDADFVDAVHTDSKSILMMGLGMSQLVGHVDFFPNNGQSQPGCMSSKLTSIITDGLIEGGRRFVACNHQRAVDFFTSTINYGSCVSVGYRCSNWNTFLEGKCAECGPDGSQCAIMGPRAIESKRFNHTNLKLYLKTSGRVPYCLFHYQIIIKLFRAKNAEDVTGSVKVTLHGEFSDLESTLSGEDVTLYAGSRYAYLVTTDKNIGQVRSVGLYWKDSSSIANPLNWIRTKKIYVEYIRVVPMNIVELNKRLAETKKLCPNNPSNPIKSKSLAVLTDKSC